MADRLGNFVKPDQTVGLILDENIENYVEGTWDGILGIGLPAAAEENPQSPGAMSLLSLPTTSWLSICLADQGEESSLFFGTDADAAAAAAAATSPLVWSELPSIGQSHFGVQLNGFKIGDEPIVGLCGNKKTTCNDLDPRCDSIDTATLAPDGTIAACAPDATTQCQGEYCPSTHCPLTCGRCQNDEDAQGMHCAAIVDTGTTLITGPEDGLIQLFNTICASATGCTEENQEAYFQDCSHLDDGSYKDLGFTLGDETFSITPDKYMMKTRAADSEFYLGPFKIDLPANPLNIVCAPAFMVTDMMSEDDGPIWILGIPFLKQYTAKFVFHADDTAGISLARTPEGGCGTCGTGSMAQQLGMISPEGVSSSGVPSIVPLGGAAVGGVANERAKAERHLTRLKGTRRAHVQKIKGTDLYKL